MNYEIKLKTNLPRGCCDARLYSDKARFEVKDGNFDDAYFAVVFEFDEWKRENYMFMPACAYNGNRFRSVERSYPPMFLEEERGFMPATTITDVPRLGPEGNLKLEATTGDMATPAVGLYARQSGQAFLIFTEQGINGSNYGITFEEAAGKAILTISYPVKRETGYAGNRRKAAEDAPLKVKRGELVEIPFHIKALHCKDINELFKMFFEFRKCSGMGSRRGNGIPFSRAWEIQEEKFNLYNYREKGGYYGVGTENSKFQDWQAGWVGGGMSSHALLLEGSRQSRERACNTLDYLFKMQSHAGFFYGIVNNGQIYGDGFDYPNTQNFHLVRKSADALYFTYKQIDLLAKRKENVKEVWISGARRCADAFVRMWREYGQWGQFIDVETGKILVGNSTSAGIAPAALALAYSFTGDEKYLETAEAAAQYYYQRDVRSGVMTGGPGEILQCPDSESSFGMLESFVVLYETTGLGKWLGYAQDAAYQCSSWCVSYNYIFPENSEFGRLDIKTTGSVFANVQNKHSAPGICTLSGNSLLKLFRATGKKEYLELMSEIGSFTVQCMSREDRPVYSWDPIPQKLLPGFICERVNMSDWEGSACVGGVFNGSCWSEVSQMLTYAEIPGVYLVSDQKLLQVTDHVKAYFNAQGNAVIENTSEYDITVKVMAENSRDLSCFLGATYESKFKRVLLKPFESAVLE